MQNMKTKKLKLTIPSSMDEIPLHRYQRFVRESMLNENNSEQWVASRMLDIFLDIPTTSVMRMTLQSMQEISELLAKTLSETPELKRVFKMGDTEFGFIPKLDEMTFGEYVDLDNFITDWDTMHKAMAVLYRPIKTRYEDKYEIQEYEGDLFHEAMKNMPLSVAMGSMLFFYRLEKDLLQTLAGYSTEGLPKATLEENGVGMQAYMLSHKETLPDSTK